MLFKELRRVFPLDVCCWVLDERDNCIACGWVSNIPKSYDETRVLRIIPMSGYLCGEAGGISVTISPNNKQYIYNSQYL